jgi:hypothetical protein
MALQSASGGGALPGGGRAEINIHRAGSGIGYSPACPHMIQINAAAQQQPKIDA